MEIGQLREKIIEIIGHGMERERAECETDEILALIKGQESRLKEIMPTDEEIVDSFEYCNPVFIEGAKWLRDKFKTK